MLKLVDVSRFFAMAIVPVALIACLGQVVDAQPGCESPVVASESFDDSLNVVSGFDPLTDNLDGGPGDFFGVGNIAKWPQGTPDPGVPFGLADDSVFSVSTNGDSAPFPGDTEGVFGENRNFNDSFFAISDTREFTAPDPPSASWTFDVTSVTCLLELQIDMGAQADEAFDGFSPLSLITFEYQFDDGDIQTAFSIAPNSDFGDFVYRPMDGGAVTPVGMNGPLEVTGDEVVSKLTSDTGVLADNTFLNKTPAEHGAMDRFITSLNGQGDLLHLTMTANLEFEAMAFDNIEIIRVPEPTSGAMLGLAALGLLLPWRRRG